MSDSLSLLTASNPNEHDWRVVTDQVMGGVSSANMAHTQHAGRDCMRLTGEVNTANNGGFIQLALDLNAGRAFDASAYAGVAIEVAGNGEEYNLHLRTSDLWLPWQSYRATFRAADWQTLKIPFSAFQAYRTFRDFNPARLERIGIVAIGRDFTADVCVSDIHLYRSEP